MNREWNCPTCTFLHQYLAPRCAMCGESSAQENDEKVQAVQQTPIITSNPYQKKHRNVSVLSNNNISAPNARESNSTAHMNPYKKKLSASNINQPLKNPYAQNRNNNIVAPTAGVKQSNSISVDKHEKAALKQKEEQRQISRSDPFAYAARQIKRVEALQFKPGIVPLDKLTCNEWIYPTNYPVRDYQLDISTKALCENTLVSLPTGLGKTLIAAVVMYNFYRWFPSGKIIFCAPTKPLVSQQIRACYDIMGIPAVDTAEISGNSVQDPSRGRKSLWETKRLFFCTPQSVEKDIASGACDPRQIVCIVLDEAHKARGDYAYRKVVDGVEKSGARFRVLGLSATPGTSLKAVQEVITNLRIGQICVRVESDNDVQRHTHDKTFEIIVVKQSSTCTAIERLLCALVTPLLNTLHRNNALGKAQGTAETLHPFVIHRAMERFHESRNGDHSMDGVFCATREILQMKSELRTHGIGVVKNHLLRIKAKSAGLMRGIIARKEFQDIEDALNQATKEGSVDASNLKVNNPKLQKLCEVLTVHFERQKALGKSTRAIVFSQLRKSVTEIVSVLSCEPILKPRKFVGQGKTSTVSGENSEDCLEETGMKQSEQEEAIRQFAEGLFNVLVCTSIGEEGLDIGQVDLIVSFDCVASPTRIVQRNGRTGRKRDGRVVMLVSEGSEEEKYKKSQSASKTLNAALKNPSDFKLVRNAHLFPHKPVCKKKEMQIESGYRMSQVGGRRTNRNRKRSRREDNVDYGNWRLTRQQEERRKHLYGSGRLRFVDHCFISATDYAEHQSKAVLFPLSLKRKYVKARYRSEFQNRVCTMVDAGATTKILLKIDSHLSMPKSCDENKPTKKFQKRSENMLDKSIPAVLQLPREQQTSLPPSSDSIEFVRISGGCQSEQYQTAVEMIDNNVSPTNKAHVSIFDVLSENDDVGKMISIDLDSSIPGKKEKKRGTIDEELDRIFGQRLEIHDDDTCSKVPIFDQPLHLANARIAAPFNHVSGTSRSPLEPKSIEDDFPYRVVENKEVPTPFSEKNVVAKCIIGEAMVENDVRINVFSSERIYGGSEPANISLFLPTPPSSSSDEDDDSQPLHDQLEVSGLLTRSAKDSENTDQKEPHLRSTNTRKTISDTNNKEVSGRPLEISILLPTQESSSSSASADESDELMIDKDDPVVLSAHPSAVEVVSTDPKNLEEPMEESPIVRKSKKIHGKQVNIFLSQLESPIFDKRNEHEEGLNPGDNAAIEENVICAICQKSHFSDDDPIVFCDGADTSCCEVAVHKTCYNITVPLEKTQAWRCNPCEEIHMNNTNTARHHSSTQSRLKKRSVPKCGICGKKDGALRRTDPPESRWAHPTCVWWTPEFFAANRSSDGDSKSLTTLQTLRRSCPERSSLKCAICSSIGGAVQCKVDKCYRAAHPHCAMNATKADGRWMLIARSKQVENREFINRFMYCDHHLDAGAGFVKDEDISTDEVFGVQCESIEKINDSVCEHELNTSSDEDSILEVIPRRRLKKKHESRVSNKSRHRKRKQNDVEANATPDHMTKTSRLKRRIEMRKRVGAAYFAVEANIDSEEDIDGDIAEERLVQDIEEDEYENDSFINDSSQLGSFRESLDVIDGSMSSQHTPITPRIASEGPSMYRQIDNDDGRSNQFRTPVFNRQNKSGMNSFLSDSLGSPSPNNDGALKGLGNMNFIRSVIHHHKEGGNAEELEKEYKKIQELGDDYKFTQSDQLDNSDTANTPLKVFSEEKKENVQARNNCKLHKLNDDDSTRTAFSSKSIWEDFSPPNHQTREMQHSRQHQSQATKNPYNAKQSRGRNTKQMQSTITTNQTTLLGGARMSNVTKESTANSMAAPIPKLTASQKARIAENKNRAMMIRQQKLAEKIVKNNIM